MLVSSGGWRRTSVALAVAVSMASATARADEADETLVVTHAGKRVPVACREALALRERDGRIYVACGPQGIVVYRLDREGPVFEERIDGACAELNEDGRCAGSESLAPPARETWVPPPTPSHVIGQPTVEREPRSPSKRWYGWQIALGVAFADALGITGAALVADHRDIGGPLLGVGILGHLLTGPIVHLAHGEREHAGMSLAVNIVVPLIPWAGTSLYFVPHSQAEGLVATEVLGTISAIFAVGAAIWDIAENSTSRRIRPRISVTPSGAFAGVGGAF
jgi:hypothetical protein